MLIGYQIFNAIEIRKEVLEQKSITTELRSMNISLNKTVETQHHVTEEYFCIISATTMSIGKNGINIALNTFMALHSALIHSIKTDRTDYEWIFLLLRKYIADISSQSIVSGFYSINGRHICCESNSPYYEMELKDIIKEFTDNIDRDEKNNPRR